MGFFFVFFYGKRRVYGDLSRNNVSVGYISPEFPFFGCFQGSWVPLLTSNLNKEAPVFDSTTVMRWLTRFSFFFYLYACSNPFFIVCFQYFLRLFRTQSALVYGYWGGCIGRGTPGWLALSWRDAIFRGGSAQRIRSTETTAGEGTMGFSQVALVWGKEAASVSPQGEEKKRYDFCQVKETLRALEMGA